MSRKRLTREKMTAAIEAAKLAGVSIARIEVRSDGMTIISDTGGRQHKMTDDEADEAYRQLSERHRHEQTAQPRPPRKTR
jgi:F0F1-type ATP synthase epsilon subunit